TVSRSRYHVRAGRGDSDQHRHHSIRPTAYCAMPGVQDPSGLPVGRALQLNEPTLRESARRREIPAASTSASAPSTAIAIHMTPGTRVLPQTREISSTTRATRLLSTDMKPPVTWASRAGPDAVSTVIEIGR